MFPRRLETDRLRLEVVTPETLDPFELYEHCNPDAPHVEAVTRYLTWEPHETPKVSFEFVREVGEQFEAGEAATYAVRPREGEEGAGELAGMAGISVDWDRHLATLGTWLRRPFWGRGYSGERAAAMFELAFDRLDLDVVAVTCHVDNENSYRAISRYVERAGGREEGVLRNHVRYPDGPADVHRFSVTSEEWAERGAGADG